MSLEYRVRPSGVVDADKLLRSLPGFRGVEPGTGSYEFGEGAMPAAHAHVSGDGIVFCANANAGSEVLAALVERIEASGLSCEVVEL